MKKYRVTKKHEYLKEGLILSDYINGNRYYSPQSNYGVTSCSNYEIDKFKENGWIEEIQQPEFTRDDMISFGALCMEYFIKQGNNITYAESFKKWIKNNKDEKENL